MDFITDKSSKFAYMEGAAAEAVRGLEVTDDSDYDKIWEMLKRRFALQDDVIL